MSTVYDTSVAETRKAGLAAASGAVDAGQLVVLPTDTVYGVGCEAFDASAVRALLQAKGRGRHMPVPVLVGSWNAIDGLVLGVSRQARQLIEAFWPGGLSLVVHHAPSLTWNLGDTRGTVMVRMPLHPVALELLRAVGLMAVSAAGRVGQAPPRNVEQAMDQLGDDVTVYLDAGPTGDAVPSTIVDLTSPDPRILREGAVSVEQISEVLGFEVAVST